MRMYDLIEKKRDGQALTSDEIHFFVEGVTSERIPDYQTSALLMAIYFQGMTPSERTELTSAMVDSGDVIDLSAISGIKVDKHSTGGVGDTTTLILGPLVASLDVPVAKMSGRGLGHTGGTIDKLEAIPGFQVDLEINEFSELVNQNRLALVGQTGNLAPADKRLYALRDVTATVNAIPLIASSIMSKKIASGSDAIVLDVKTGAGAFMKDSKSARELAEAMVAIGREMGRKTMAVLSDMSQPLGQAIGNALEVREAIDTLNGQGPEDLTELCLTLGSQMVVLAEKADTIEQAREMLQTNLQNGKALQQFKTFLQAQGGDISVVDDPTQLPQAAHKIPLKAKQTGVIKDIVADQIGKSAMMLGAGRATKDDNIDLSAGIVMHKKIGDAVSVGDTLLTLHTNKEEVDDVCDLLLNSIIITTDASVSAPALIHDIIMR